MKVAFLTEMGFNSTVPVNHSNMRTEFAWMSKLNAMHYNIADYDNVRGYDHIFIIFPKGELYVSAIGKTIVNGITFTSKLLEVPIVSTLKQNNGKVYIIQEGPHWLWNDYTIPDQFAFYGMLNSCDGIFAHNKSDISYYKGMFPDIPVWNIPSLMIRGLISDIPPAPSDKVLVGGNFARWYGGFESFVVASRFGLPIWAPKSHAKRDQEELIDGLNHFEWSIWVDWMREVSKFKYAVHLMPTVAAGTFSLNCAYFGIPTIGNEKLDTQRLLFPDLSIDVDNVLQACELADRLKYDTSFYTHCSELAIQNYKKYYDESVWLNHIKSILE